MRNCFDVIYDNECESQNEIFLVIHHLDALCFIFAIKSFDETKMQFIIKIMNKFTLK